jgi:hypothetical protein
MGKKLIFGKIIVQEGDCLDVLVSGRKYVIKVIEVTDYNQIVGETPSGDPVMIRASKIVALRKISPEAFEAMKGAK